MDSRQDTLLLVEGDLGILEALALAVTEERSTSLPQTFAEPYGEANVDQATDILKEAAECIGDRASERDTEEERSMASTVRAFNGMYGTELTEEQGWQFMVLLKMARAKGGEYRRDDFVDGAAYFALAGECRSND